jgi:outer membrane immunogenic protein
VIGYALALAHVTLAADLPQKVLATPPVHPPTRTGFYLGVNAGWVGAADGTQQLSGTDTASGGLGFLLSSGFIPSAFNLRPDGFIGGGQIGYNWQVSNWLFGLEADFDGTKLKGTQSERALAPFVASTYTQTLTHELEWLATVRARIGLTWEQLLLYGTGGLAVGHTGIGLSAFDVIVPLPGLDASTFNDQTGAGWTIGGGVEWLFRPQWSLKAEYLHVDLGTASPTISYAYVVFNQPNITNNSTLTARINERYDIARVGLNYHFSP